MGYVVRSTLSGRQPFRPLLFLRQVILSALLYQLLPIDGEHTEVSSSTSSTLTTQNNVNSGIPPVSLPYFFWVAWIKGPYYWLLNVLYMASNRRLCRW